MELQLNPDNVKNRSEVKSSLTDLYGISIFTDEFGEQAEKLQEQKELEKDELYKKVFSYSLDFKDNEQEEIQELLFQKNSQLILTEDYTKESYKVSVYEILIISIPAILLLYFYWYQGSKKRRRKKQNDNINFEI